MMPGPTFQRSNFQSTGIYVMTLLPTARRAAAQINAALAQRCHAGTGWTGWRIPHAAALALLALVAVTVPPAAIAHADDQLTPPLEGTGLSVTIAKTVPGYVRNGGGGSGNTGPLISRSWLPILMTLEKCRASLVDEFSSIMQDAGLGSALPAARPTLPDGATRLNVNV